jgi:AcrR family transcriptional regulator
MCPSSPSPDRRRYDGSGRRAQAAETRLRILVAARELFIAQGYGPTTIAAIAAQAEVSVPTVYAGFETKAALLKRAIDVSIVGDDEDVPMVDRPTTHWVSEATTAEGVLGRYAVVACEISERVAPILDVLLRAAGTDPELDALAREYDAQRLFGADRIAREVVARTKLPKGRTRAAVRDLIWLGIAPEQYTLLVTRRGWSRDRYQVWLTDTLLGVLDAPATVAI